MADTRPRPMDDALADGRGDRRRGNQTPPGGYRPADYRYHHAEVHVDSHRAAHRTPPFGYAAASYDDGDVPYADGVSAGPSPWDGTPPGGYAPPSNDHADVPYADGFYAGPPRADRTPPGGYPAGDYDYVGHHYAGHHHDHHTDQDEDRLDRRLDDEVPDFRSHPGGYRAAEYQRWVDDDVTTPEPEPVAPEPPPPGPGRVPNPPPAPVAAPALLPPSPPVAAGVAAAFAAGLVAAWVVLVALRWPDPPAGGGPLAALDALVNRAVAADRVLSVTTWVENVATLLVVGGACFRLYVSRPAITGRGASESALVAASLVGIFACVVPVPLRAMVVSGRGLPAAGDLDALGLVATSRFGDAACVGLLAFVLFAVALARRRGAGAGGCSRWVAPAAWSGSSRSHG